MKPAAVFSFELRYLVFGSSEQRNHTWPVYFKRRDLALKKQSLLDTACDYVTY